jgi:hypothetical protein
MLVGSHDTFLLCESIVGSMRVAISTATYFKKKVVYYFKFKLRTSQSFFFSEPYVFIKIKKIYGFKH